MLIRTDWKKEPVLQFGFMTMQAMISEIDKETGGKMEPTYSESVFFDYDADPQLYWPYALKWYKRAALQKEPLAVEILRQIECFKSTEQKATEGDAEAQYLLSVYYHDSYGTYQDFEKCTEWLKKAAINGNEDAVRSIAEWNRLTGCKQKLSDPDFSAEPDFYPDEDNIFLGGRHGWVDEENRELAHVDIIWEKFYNLDFDDTLRAAEAGDAEKQYQLAWLYDWGKGTEQDTKKAIEWFVRSAYNGYAPAQTEVGILYHAGIMVTKSKLEVFSGKG
ncbi:tetratricopeptide repeat protein [Succiniclasticum ruminis]|uniref:Sel1 repeat-containing protein n=1 Tax=Succiniclasticum ruminis DSM 9236 TaxID=1123323 RepID=A0A1I1YHA7_9FIRM|nr:tetratricopeptide repeat protein [Succiniclasticum ruminis]SFE17503.1 Sel1 repeat-containing protein [Succiniclasticum ruminis DSM 9236]